MFEGFRYALKLRKAQAELRKLQKSIDSSVLDEVFAPGSGPGSIRVAIAEARLQHKDLYERIERLQSQYITELANKYVIPLPTAPYDGGICDADVIQDLIREGPLLSGEERKKLLAEIRSEERERWEMWARWIPFVTALTGLLGTLIGLVTTLK